MSTLRRQMRKSGPAFSPTVAALPGTSPFIGPETMERQRGRRLRARLGANENAFGPSPFAIEAMRQAASETWMYADPDNHELRTALAAYHHCGLENIVIGEGIDGLLGLTCMVFLSPGQSVVTTDGAYATFNFHVAAHGGRVVKIPMRDAREDLDALLATARKENAPLVYVSNPNNPMGSWWPGAEIEHMVAQLPDGMLLILDEAYCETAPPDAIAAIPVSHPQVIRYRTFSKAYGLAGARIGYALGEPTTIAAFDRVRNQYGINRSGQIGALAALRDHAYLKTVVERIAEGRRRIDQIAQDNGLEALPSGANFVAIDCGRDGAFSSRVLDELLARDVFVRKPLASPVDRCIRVSTGRDEDLDIFAEELPRALAAAGG